jgi:hypothetical protein
MKVTGYEGHIMLSYGAENVRGTGSVVSSPYTAHDRGRTPLVRRGLTHEALPPPYRFDHAPNGALNNVDTADALLRWQHDEVYEGEHYGSNRQTSLNLSQTRTTIPSPVR